MLNVKELGGARLRKALKAKIVKMGFHNKNKSGGNFGITIIIPHSPGEPDRVDAGAGMTKENQQCYELWGFHNLEGNIYRLTFGGCSSGGKSDITSRAPNLNSLLQLMFKAIYPNEAIPMSLQTPPEEPLVSYETSLNKTDKCQDCGKETKFAVKKMGVVLCGRCWQNLMQKNPKESYETGNNPWVEIIGGDTTFGRIDIGATFHFPNADVDYVKASKSTYKSLNTGLSYHTGRGTAVISGKHKDWQASRILKEGRKETEVPEEPLVSYETVHLMPSVWTDEEGHRHIHIPNETRQGLKTFALTFLIACWVAITIRIAKMK